MHELSVAVEIVERAVMRARGARLRRIAVEVGPLSCISSDALTFCFELATAGTQAEGAQLEIRRPGARVRCAQCSLEFELWEPYGSCRCGSTDLDWLSGRELALVELEIETQVDLPPAPQLETE